MNDNTHEQQVADLKRQLDELTERFSQHTHGYVEAYFGYEGDRGTHNAKTSLPVVTEDDRPACPDCTGEEYWQMTQCKTCGGKGDVARP